MAVWRRRLRDARNRSSACASSSALRPSRLPAGGGGRPALRFSSAPTLRLDSGGGGPVQTLARDGVGLHPQQVGQVVLLALQPLLDLDQLADHPVQLRSGHEDGQIHQRLIALLLGNPPDPHDRRDLAFEPAIGPGSRLSLSPVQVRQHGSDLVHPQTLAVGVLLKPPLGFRLRQGRQRPGIRHPVVDQALEPGDSLGGLVSDRPFQRRDRGWKTPETGRPVGTTAPPACARVLGSDRPRLPSTRRAWEWRPRRS